MAKYGDKIEITGGFFTGGKFIGATGILEESEYPDTLGKIPWPAAAEFGKPFLYIDSEHDFTVIEPADEVIWEIRIDGGRVHNIAGADKVLTFVDGVRAAKPDAVIERRVWETF